MICHSANQPFLKSTLKNNSNVVVDATSNVVSQTATAFNSSMLTTTTFILPLPTRMIIGVARFIHSPSFPTNKSPATDCQNNSQNSLTTTIASSSALPSRWQHHLLYPLYCQLYIKVLLPTLKKAALYRIAESMTRRSQ